VSQDKTDLAREEQAERQKYADLAMTAIGQAVAAGYKNVEHMKQDKDLDPLRSRPDFQELQHELEAKASMGAK
jgi:hypothetical protein